MAKIKTTFFCSDCGHESPRWLGQCPGCRSWNTMVEELTQKKSANHISQSKLLPAGNSVPTGLEDIDTTDDIRMATNIEELDRVLGGGIVSGSLTLVGGDPGIGKSTILLQMCRSITDQGKVVLYVSGEESLRQIKIRAERLNVTSNKVLLLAEVNFSLIHEAILKTKPDVLIIDSIQTVYTDEITSAPGSVSQVKAVTNLLMQIAKGMQISTFLVGHVTKEGAIAGPRVLEHMVDTVLYFEGERSATYRILRAVKNRFGSTNEIGVFEMKATGLVEVKNPSEYMLKGRPIGEAGSLVTCCMEGTRPLLVEIQALVSPTNFGLPRRTAYGTDYNRVNLLVAVLEKKLGLELSQYDSYINVAGGIKVNEPALDLGIIVAVASIYRNKPINESTVIMGEVGLTGEVRGIGQIEQRLSEVHKLGFKTCIIPEANMHGLKDYKNLKIHGISHIKETTGLLF
ncbi:MAG: DNA repair protein RadA [Vallitaleaceae bacterium]|jgi:DNA repair protein RadA/Sms|nr:DNA repair protein RadA [Vallitaleaceae bacterium]